MVDELEDRGDAVGGETTVPELPLRGLYLPANTTFHIRHDRAKPLEGVERIAQCPILVSIARAVTI